MGAGDRHCLARWAEHVRTAASEHRPLCLRGGGSKDFYGGALVGEVFDTREYAGVVAYEPSELFVTARCGTLLAELEALLAGHGQMLAFEPPHFGPRATIGGCVAAGLSGPRRARAGAVRDFVLGARLLDGRGDVLAFGGQVMKNVAGYDVSRLLAGSLGTLGVLVEVSLKVMPISFEQTLRFDFTQETALDLINRWAGQPLPISASAWGEGALHVRLAGPSSAIAAARKKIGGDVVEEESAGDFWRGLREQSHPFFSGAGALWRLALPATSPVLAWRATQLVEWGGAQRWLRASSDFDPAEADSLRRLAQDLDGHATLFRAEDAQKAAVGVFAPLSEPLARIHRRLKRAFDPAAVFNRGRLYPDF